MKGCVYVDDNDMRVRVRYYIDGKCKEKEFRFRKKRTREEAVALAEQFRKELNEVYNPKLRLSIRESKNELILRWSTKEGERENRSFGYKTTGLDATILRAKEYARNLKLEVDNIDELIDNLRIRYSKVLKD